MPARPGPDRQLAEPRPGRTPPTSRTVPPRYPPPARGIPASAPARPANAPFRRRCCGPACVPSARQIAGALPICRTRDTPWAVGPPRNRVGATTLQKPPLPRPQLGPPRLDPNVVAALVGHLTGQLQYRFERIGGCGHERNLLCDGPVFADRFTPLHPFTGPLPRDFYRPFDRPGTNRRYR